MPSKEWESFELGELIDIKHGYAFKGEYFHEGPPGDILLTPGNFAIGGGFKYDKLRYYRGPVPEEYVLSPGDLLVTMTDLSKEADTLGYPAVVPLTGPAVHYLHNQRLGLVTIKQPDKIIPEFLYYLMCTRSYRNEIIAGATGTTVKHTSPSKMYRFAAKIPPIDTQKNIAAILSSFDAGISLNREMNRALEELARSIFRAWFVDFEPVKAKVRTQRAFPGMPQEVFEQLPDSLSASEIGLIPSSWEIVSLASLVKLLSGGTPKRKVSSYWNGEIPWFSVRDAPSGNDVWVIETRENITNAGVENSAAQVLRPGSTIISARGTVGRLALAAVPMAINQSCYGLQGTDGVGDFFVYFAMRHSVSDLRQRTHGSVFDTITRQTFETMNFVYPDALTLAAFEASVEPYLSQMKVNRFENRGLAATRDLILQRLVFGELMVPGNGGADGGLSWRWGLPTSRMPRVA